jgi:hypothetical protein
MGGRYALTEIMISQSQHRQTTWPSSKQEVPFCSVSNNRDQLSYVANVEVGRLSMPLP